jgi:hypothetical protein
VGCARDWQGYHAIARITVHCETTPYLVEPLAFYKDLYTDELSQNRGRSLCKEQLMELTHSDSSLMQGGNHFCFISGLPHEERNTVLYISISKSA